MSTDYKKFYLVYTFPILFIFFTTNCFANTYFGEGIADTEIEADNDAYIDLKKILAEVSNLTPSRSASFYRKRLTLPIIGETTETMNTNGLYHSRIQIDSSSVETYKQRITEVNNEINQLSQHTDSDSLHKLLTKLNELDGLSKVLHRLSNNTEASVSKTEDEVKISIFKQQKAQTNIELAIAKSIKKLGIKEKEPIQIYPPFPEGSTEITPFSKTIQTLYQEKIDPKNRNGVKHSYIMGEYEIIDNAVLLSIFVYDHKNKPINCTIIKLSKSNLTDSELIPTFGNFTHRLMRGFVRIQSSDSYSSLSLKSKIKNSGKFQTDLMRVSLKTDKGTNGISYFIGDSDNLYFKLSEPGYIYIVGHILKKDKTLSYILPLNNRRGHDRFIKRVKAIETKKWQLLGEFQVDAPHGLEALQIFASSKYPAKSLPKAFYNQASGLYIIGSNPENTVEKLRGLVKLSSDKKQDDQENAKNQIQFHEDYLQFTTLSKIF